MATAPTSFRAQSMGRNSAVLTWIDGAGNAFVEMFYHTADDFSASSFGGLATQGDQRGEVTGLTAGTAYYFWIKGRDAADAVSSEVGSVSGTTAGNAGIAGTNVVEQIRDGMNTRLAAVLGTDYKKLAYIRDIDKNSYQTRVKGYGVIVGSAEPAEESINRSFTFDQTFTVVLSEGAERKNSERDQETAALTLATAMDSIYKDFKQTQLGLPSLVIQVEPPTIDEREVSEDGGTVALRANFTITYRQAFR